MLVAKGETDQGTGEASHAALVRVGPLKAANHVHCASPHFLLAGPQRASPVRYKQKLGLLAIAGSDPNQGIQVKVERSHAGTAAGGELTSNNVWDRYLYPFGADGEAASTHVLL